MELLRLRTETKEGEKGMNTISDTGLRILKILDKMNKSQRWLSIKADVSENAISRFIRGKQDIRLSDAIRIAAALKVSLDWLFLGV